MSCPCMLNIICGTQVPCILGVNLTGKDLMEFIQQLDETDGSSAMPPAVLRILNFKACGGPTMFVCSWAADHTVPIVNVASLHGELARHQMLSGRQAETWYGLAHQEPSLERA
ncbi:DNA mismatch repair protein MLH3-like isoform X2 [Panicum hallii]|uniref:DNA mismatch repair protein MLH3-like isoform X2 n=1 Tax=Panicum hallii TaxID=206008 RepID=UPI000DF4DA8B|nr:DNA mismatch repair protein MLH3-like isoform X2 [Panicum hallii]